MFTTQVLIGGYNILINIVPEQLDDSLLTYWKKMI